MLGGAEAGKRWRNAGQVPDMLTSLLRQSALQILSEEETALALTAGKELLKKRLHEIEDVKNMVVRKQNEARMRNETNQRLLEANFDISTFFWMRIQTLYRRHVEEHVFNACRWLSGAGLLMALQGLVAEHGPSLVRRCNEMLPLAGRMDLSRDGSTSAGIRTIVRSGLSAPVSALAGLGSVAVRSMAQSVKLVVGVPSKTNACLVAGAACGYALWALYEKEERRKNRKREERDQSVYKPEGF